jgi:hypothetical protein
MVEKPRWWTLDGHTPVPTDDIMEWGRLFDETPGGRAVGKDTIGDVFVSTVFLGMDHGYGEGPPILFETMVFRGEMDQYQWRYATWAEAEAGHARVVAAVRENRVLDDG